MREPFERRTVTVLSTDMVGYSRMMALDPDATVQAIRFCEQALRESADRYRGRLFSRAGDGFLVEFEREFDAVQAGLEIQHELRMHNSEHPLELQIWLRAGIHCGEAIIDDDNLHGDVVNIAVRLQEIAPSGGMLISDAVRDTLPPDDRPPMSSLGVMRFKNIPRPIEALELQVPGADGAVQMSDPFEIDMAAPVSGFGGRSAIAIFPLNNSSHSLQHSHIPEGFSDNLIVALSHMRQVPVIDRNSSFALAAAREPHHRAATRLGARYFVTGEFADHGPQFRISVRLFDGSTSQILWSDSYLLEPDEVIAALEEVSDIVAGTLEGQLEQAETVRARASRLSRSNISDLVWRGRWHLNKLTQKDSELAREMLEAAVDQDPEHSEALIQLSFWHWLDCWTQRKPKQNVEQFQALAERAMTSKPHDSRGHFLIGAAEILQGNPQQALGHFQQSLALNPSHAHAHSQVGSCHMLMGQPDRAIASLDAAIRLNPHDYYLFVTVGELACSHCMSGDYERAISLARQSLDLRQSYWHARMTEITALVQSGKEKRAAQALDALLIRRPDFFEMPYIEWLPFQDKKWNRFFEDSLAKARALDLDLGTENRPNAAV
ncbi:MAG: tetratricopeptide repeat protein [Alphaproteobacteria bacterium]|nr:tetratricopeptide repeat protein [Alphaproteobacteria bacterium]